MTTKLKNIIMAAAALLLFAGCSKDSDFNPSPDQELQQARLSVAVKASGFSASGLDPNALEGELNLNNLTAAIFSEDGSELLSSLVSGAVNSTDGTALLSGIPVKTARGQLVIIANAPADLLNQVTSLDDLQNKLARLDTQNQQNLTMSTSLIRTTTDFTEGDNYIGVAGQTNVNGINAPVELTRIAARIEVNSLATVFDGTGVSGRVLRINSIFVQQVRTASYFFSPDYWGQVMYADNSCVAPGTSNILHQDIISDSAPINETVYRRYVMENFDPYLPTRIVVVCTLLGNEVYQARSYNFMATINLNGIKNGYDHNYVKRNYIYRLGITFNGNSFNSGPEILGDLDVQVEVVSWSPVEQNIEIE